jgi:hypothetical protein
VQGANAQAFDKLLTFATSTWKWLALGVLVLALWINLILKPDDTEDHVS